MPSPTFMVIGAQKCGTTWLAEMLKQHPDVLTPIEKELHFFNKATAYRRGIDWYENQFIGHTGQSAIGEFSPNYLWTSHDQGEIDESDRNRGIPRLVYRHYPDVKLIVTLRDPVHRAVSAYNHHIRHRRFSPRRRILDVTHRYGITTMGYYHAHLSAWLDVFPREQLLILIYEEDIAQRKDETLQRVFRFIGVDDDFLPANTHERYNARPGGLYLHLFYLFPKMTRRVAGRLPLLQRIDLPRIRVSDDEIRVLARIYDEPNRKLEEFLGRELPWVRSSDAEPGVRLQPAARAVSDRVS